MSEIKHAQFLKLQAMGKEPLNLPAEIYFAGNEELQKRPGAHHLPQYRQTGTYNLPAVKEMRKRVAMDRAKRLINMKMTEVELRKIGGIEALTKQLAEHGLSINEQQKEIASMHADMLTKEWEAKRKDRLDEKLAQLAKAGQAYEEVKADLLPPVDAVKATQAAQSVRLAPSEDLSSLKDESQKDKEAEAGQKQSVAVAFESVNV